MRLAEWVNKDLELYVINKSIRLEICNWQVYILYIYSYRAGLDDRGDLRSS